MTSPNPAWGHIGCRQISDDDRDAVIALLCEGFEASTSEFWGCALETLRTRALPASCPRYGYCLTANDEVVGVLLLIYSRSDDEIRCNVSSWYVRPTYRIYAPTLIKIARRRTDCKYINTSSEFHTRQGLLVQGYVCYAEGQFIAVPALGLRHAGVVVKRVRSRADAAEGYHGQLLADHAEHRCISLTCTTGDRTHPFVFLKRRIPRVNLPYAQLVFCEDMDFFVKLHANIGYHLLMLGIPVVMLDANGPMGNVAGRYLRGRMPKYYMGKAPPRLGDLSYTEDVLFDHDRR